MSCEQTINDISTNISSLITKVNTLQSDITSIKTTVGALTNTNLTTLIEEVAKISYSLNVEAGQVDSDLRVHSLIQSLHVKLGTDSDNKTINEKIDLIDFNPDITVSPTAVNVTTETVNVDLSTVNTKLTNLQSDSTWFKEFLGAIE